MSKFWSSATEFLIVGLFGVVRGSSVLMILMGVARGEASYPEALDALILGSIGGGIGVGAPDLGKSVFIRV